MKIIHHHPPPKPLSNLESAIFSPPRAECGLTHSYDMNDRYAMICDKRTNIPLLDQLNKKMLNDMVVIHIISKNYGVMINVDSVF